jgi:isorenieratene synthase
LAIYSQFPDPYVAWAEQNGGSVVESHAYAIPPQDQGSVEDHREALLGELRLAFPELKDAKVLHSEAMTQDNFTRFGVGEWSKRSPVNTEVPNLYLAGDHVKLDFPAFLMEAAVSSGRLAAAHICAQAGVVEPELFAVEPEGRLAGVIPESRSAPPLQGASE